MRRIYLCQCDGGWSRCAAEEFARAPAPRRRTPAHADRRAGITCPAEAIAAGVLSSRNQFDDEVLRRSRGGLAALQSYSRDTIEQMILIH